MSVTGWEHYVVSVDPATGQLLPDDQLRTEIAWPVRTDTEPSDTTPSDTETETP